MQLIQVNISVHVMVLIILIFAHQADVDVRSLVRDVRHHGAFSTTVRYSQCSVLLIRLLLLILDNFEIILNWRDNCCLRNVIN